MGTYIYAKSTSLIKQRNGRNKKERCVRISSGLYVAIDVRCCGQPESTITRYSLPLNSPFTVIGHNLLRGTILNRHYLSLVYPKTVDSVKRAR